VISEVNMRKALILFVSMMFYASLASAAPAYGTKMPGKNKFFGGVQHYEIFDRDLNNDNGNLKSRQEHILLSYGVTDWFTLDLKASAGTIEHHAVDGRKIKYNRPVWGGGYGFRVRLYEGGPLKMVAGFQHISIHPETVKKDGEKNNAILDDWQGSALVSYDLKKFTPYTGVRYGSTDYLHRLNNDANRVFVDEDRRVDAVLGVDVPLGEKVWVNIEGAFGAGKALATSVNYKF